ncbi:hypothetical protein AAFC00_006318 [Neodothiora populina]|uniref:20S-pre-rRNA D-site endonuclease NOB1 n=1 Tax=Neodothiora populina TaxID=2781224 RepID=A0ABR3P4R8_9PEZI
MSTQKPVHTIVLDTGAIIKNHPTVSTLLAQAESLVTVPAIITEIRDAATRSRVETQLSPFLTLRSPTPDSIKVVSDFARKTGDLAVLSKPDIQIIALAYELECERNGGDWRLRRVPGQKGLNGSPPSKAKPEESKDDSSAVPGDDAGTIAVQEISPVENASAESSVTSTEDQPEADASKPADATDADLKEVTDDLASANLKDSVTSSQPEQVQAAEQEDESDSDSDGWITPSNLKKQQAKDAGVSVSGPAEPSTMQVGTLTTDFAMQNVILQMNLNLLSPSMHRVKNLKTFVLRCHACFQICKQMDKQFCPRCGGPTLTRVACSTDSKGEFKLHLKKNMQWNTRGDRFSIPKAVHGSSNGRIQGGGKGGWGNDLILAEDQKEYLNAQTLQKRSKERDLMDEDYLPSILTGARGKTGGRIKVGAGRNVNARKR